MALKTAPQHFFSKQASVNASRYSMSRSQSHLSTINAGYLVPLYRQEVLPGETYNMRVDEFIRMLSPLDVPMYDNLYNDWFFFFVPNRLTWDNWPAFMGQKRKPTDRTDYVTPKVAITSPVEVNSIYQYMGCPYGTSGYYVLAFPFRSYYQCYNDWFRDEQRIEFIDYPTGDGPDPMSTYTLLKRGKRFDYITSTTLSPQIGDPVSIPLGTTAPVIGNGFALGLQGVSSSAGYVTIFNSSVTDQGLYSAGNFTSPIVAQNSGSARLSTDTVLSGLPTWSDSRLGLQTDPALSGVVADLSNATSATVTTFQTAMQLQAFNMLLARGGTRYTEILYQMFGVISPDSRLQRAEFLGGSHNRILVTPVVQNSSTDSVSPQGNLSAFVWSNSSKHAFTRSFTEHGWIIGMCCIYADLRYQQGLHRSLMRDTWLDYFWPQFANLADQAVTLDEIYLQSGTVVDGVITPNANNKKVYGYSERFGEYKYGENRISGELVSSYPQSLDNWHLAQYFESEPLNDKNFIEENPPIDRIVAVQDEVQFLIDVRFNVSCVTEVPAYNDPMKWFMRS